MKWMILVVGLCLVPADLSSAQILGGSPAPLQTPHKNEFQWAIGETAADILDVAAAIKGSRPAAPATLPDKPWNPNLFVTFARTSIGSIPQKDSGSVPPQYVALADLTAIGIVRANDTVSASIRQHPASARAHESAALVLGAFGLRDAANDLSDVRWTLNRMTAHLAIAEVLRGDRPAGIDGQLALVTFHALANRTTTALRILDTVAETPGDAALASWKRALRLRLTHDWRVAAAPSKTPRVEKLEYFRARRKTLKALRAGQELAVLMEPVAPDFARIVQNFRHGVEDGHEFVNDALGGELVELGEVYRAMHRREPPKGLPAEVINVRAGRLMQNGHPQVVSWGAWAEFFQRHIGMYIGSVDYFQRRLLGSPDAADRTKAALNAGLQHLTLYPVASSRRTRGRGLEADLTYINQAVDLAARAPELVNFDYWTFLDMGARYEPVRHGMPDQFKWFASPSSADVPFEAGMRARLGHPLSTPDLEALVAEASSDVSLAAHALAPRPMAQALIARVVTWLRARAAYDLYAVDAAANWARTWAEQIEWRRQGCALAISECVDLAWLLAMSGDTAGAVAEYERAFRDPAMDAVAIANSAGWLVWHYEHSGQMQRAYDLAERAAAIGSGRGLTTLARLYERRNRIEEAAALYERRSNRYERSSDELAGFLFRQAVVGKKAAFADRWKAVEKSLFPGGLQPLPSAMPDQPATGVFVYKDTNVTRRVRLQAGDIIVGVDGWRVENKEQYDAVLAFSDQGAMHKITAWRGMLFTVDLPDNHGAELQTHPLRGWIQ